MKQTFIIAKYEFFRLLKNRWLFVFTILFAVINIVLIFISQDIYKGEKELGFTRLSSSVNNLVLIFIPLISLLLSAQSFSGDKNDNFLSLIKTYPVKIGEYVFGKYFGLLFSLTASIFLGFGSVFIISSFFVDRSFLKNTLILSILSGVLLLIFTSWGAYIGSKVKNRLTALTASLIIWFFAVFVYELFIWFLLPKISYAFQKVTLLILLLLNPVESVRMGIVFLQKQGAVFGTDFYYWQSNFNSLYGYLGGILLIGFYTLIPIFFTALKIKSGK